MLLYDRSSVSIDLGLNIAINRIATLLFPTGFDVSDNAPDTFDALRQHVDQTGRMLVWSGASDCSIFGDAETNWAFRAWHDYHHLKHNLPFTPEGEHAVMLHQCRDLIALYGHTAQVARWCHILQCEVDGQVKYQQSHGGAFPRDQRAFTEAYLIDPVTACAPEASF